MPKGIGGGASMPSPGWYFLAAAAAYVASLIGIRATMYRCLDLPGTGIEVTVDSESDDRGILGLGARFPRARCLFFVVSVRGGGPGRDAIEEIGQWAVDHCPVTDTAAGPSDRGQARLTRATGLKAREAPAWFDRRRGKSGGARTKHRTRTASAVIRTKTTAEPTEPGVPATDASCVSRSVTTATRTPVSPAQITEIMPGIVVKPVGEPDS